MKQRQAARVDANQATIVKELRDRGALVVILGQPVDLLVGYRGEWALVEVKSGPGARVRPKQSDFLDQCRENQVACFLIDDLDDVETFCTLVADPVDWEPDSTAND